METDMEPREISVRELTRIAGLGVLVAIYMREKSGRELILTMPVPAWRAAVLRIFEVPDFT